MKRWARRNLPTVVLLAALILLAALVLAIAMPRETENTPVVSAAISPTFDEAAYTKPIWITPQRKKHRMLQSPRRSK